MATYAFIEVPFLDTDRTLNYSLLPDQAYVFADKVTLDYNVAWGASPLATGEADVMSLPAGFMATLVVQKHSVAFAGTGGVSAITVQLGRSKIGTRTDGVTIDATTFDSATGGFTGLASGDVLTITGGPNAGWYTVASVTNDNRLVINETFPDTSESGQTFKIGFIPMFSPKFDVKQTVGDGVVQISNEVVGNDSAAALTIQAQIVISGGTTKIQNLTAGSLDIQIAMVKAPTAAAGRSTHLVMQKSGGIVTMLADDLVAGEYLQFESATSRIRSKARVTSGRLIDVQIYTGNNTWNKPTGTDFIVVEGMGGGGGGGGAHGGVGAGSAGGTGGSSGSYAIKKIVNPSSSYAVTIGGGGAGGGGGPPAVAGTNGNNTTFGTALTCAGGNGGAADNAQAGDFINVGMAGNPSTGGDINGMGASGHHGMTLAGVIGNGGAGGGYGGGESQVNGPGINATANTGGGGGGAGVSAANLGFAGGNGGSGWMIVYSYSDDL